MDFEELQREVVRLVYDGRVTDALAELERLSQGALDQHERARLSRLRGEVLLHADRPFPEVVANLRTALTDSYDLPEERAKVCVDLLAVAHLAGDLDLADEAHGLWLGLEEMHPHNEEILALNGRATFNLAWIEHLRGNSAEAARLFRQVAEIYEKTQKHPREQADQSTFAALAWIFYAREQMRLNNLVKARFGLDGAKSLVDDGHYLWPLYCCVQAELSLILGDRSKSALWLDRIVEPVRFKEAQILALIIRARLTRHASEPTAVVNGYTAEARRLLARHYRAYLDRELSTLF